MKQLSQGMQPGQHSLPGKSRCEWFQDIRGCSVHTSRRPLAPLGDFVQVATMGCHRWGPWVRLWVVRSGQQRARPRPHINNKHPIRSLSARGGAFHSPEAFSDLRQTSWERPSAQQGRLVSRWPTASRKLLSQTQTQHSRAYLYKWRLWN